MSMTSVVVVSTGNIPNNFNVLVFFVAYAIAPLALNVTSVISPEPANLFFICASFSSSSASVNIRPGIVAIVESVVVVVSIVVVVGVFGKSSYGVSPSSNSHSYFWPSLGSWPSSQLSGPVPGSSPYSSLASSQDTSIMHS